MLSFFLSTFFRPITTLAYYVSPRRLARFASDVKSAEVHIPVDVTASAEGYTIFALLPGIKAEDVKIEVLEDTVSIQGEFPASEGEDARYLLQERPTGSFNLPTALDAAKAEANVADGVLKLYVPKAEEARAKQIQVKAK